MEKILIVESPSKSKTIEGYLDKGYKVLSSKGHVRDLSTRGEGGLGVEVKNDFRPMYEVAKDKKELVNDLIKQCKNKEVYIATDPDREGEAIGFHLAEILGLDHDKANRVIFNEITKKAVLTAMSNPRKLDMNLVNSQETRRIIDRIIGFKLSKLLQSKIKLKSAGRVQSVALKLICELENQIRAFIPEEYYEIFAYFPNFKTKLNKYKYEKLEIRSLEEAENILKALKKEFLVDKVEFKEYSVDSKAAYITSTLQQDAANKLGFSSSKTMKIAQALYEGKKIGAETTGLITYMRTDSERLSDDFISETKSLIEKEFGKEYLGAVKVKNQKNSQDAHEAVRPTDINIKPENVKDFLTKDEHRLYNLIYSRALASLMSKARYRTQKVFLNNNDYIFEAAFTNNLFDGYLRVYKDDEDEISKFIDLKEGMLLNSDKIESIQNFTKPKSRYTEAKLIKELEELGIGRPSTYATVVKTILDRGYVELEKKHFIPTENGFLAFNKLEEYFKSIINADFTAEMEQSLDDISTKKADKTGVITEFYNTFMPLFSDAQQKMEKIAPVILDELCPECNASLVKRKGRYGDFTACNNYPACRYVKKEFEEKYHETKCPKCGGLLVERTARKGKNRGKKFFSCKNYPKCEFILNEQVKQ